MKKPRRGIVIELNLEPAKGSETGRTRPCVVVTNDTYNERVPVIQVTPITAWSEKKHASSPTLSGSPRDPRGSPKERLPIACKHAPWIGEGAWFGSEDAWQRSRCATSTTRS